jgi:hypothetical protein
MGKSTPSAPKPDPNIGKAALQQAQTGEEWLGFAKDAFKVSTQRQADLDALTKQVTTAQLGLAQDQQQYAKDVTNKQLGLAQQQMDLSRKIADQQLEQSGYQFQKAQEDRARYEQVYQPKEDEYLKAVADYDPTARQAERDQLTGKLVNQQLDIANRYGDAAKADRANYEKNFQPIEEQIAADARTYASPERQAEAAAEAKADVQSAAQAARASAQRQAASMGVNPASGRFAGINRASDLATTLATAGAANTARQQVRDQGYQRQVTAANLGRGLAAQGMQEEQLGIGAGQTANQTSAAAEQERQAAEMRKIGLEADG